MTEYELTWRPSADVDQRFFATLLRDIDVACNDLSAQDVDVECGGCISVVSPLTGLTEWSVFVMSDSDVAPKQLASAVEGMLDRAGISGADRHIEVSNLELVTEQRERLQTEYADAYRDMLAVMRAELLNWTHSSELDFLVCGQDSSDAATWWATARFDIPDANVVCRLGASRPTVPVWPPMLPLPRPTGRVQWCVQIQFVDQQLDETEWNEAVVRSTDVAELIQAASAVVLNRIPSYRAAHNIRS